MRDTSTISNRDTTIASLPATSTTTTSTTTTTSCPVTTTTNNNKTTATKRRRGRMRGQGAGQDVRQRSGTNSLALFAGALRRRDRMDRGVIGMFSFYIHVFLTNYRITNNNGNGNETTDHEDPRRTTRHETRARATNGPQTDTAQRLRRITAHAQQAWHDPRPTTTTNTEGGVRARGRAQSSSSFALLAGRLRRRDLIDRSINEQTDDNDNGRTATMNKRNHHPPTALALVSKRAPQPRRTTHCVAEATQSQRTHGQPDERMTRQPGHPTPATPPLFRRVRITHPQDHATTPLRAREAHETTAAPARHTTAPTDVRRPHCVHEEHASEQQTTKLEGGVRAAGRISSSSLSLLAGGLRRRDRIDRGVVGPPSRPRRAATTQPLPSPVTKSARRAPDHVNAHQPTPAAPPLTRDERMASSAHPPTARSTSAQPRRRRQTTATPQCTQRTRERRPRHDGTPPRMIGHVRSRFEGTNN
ncbi:hypothetical protein BD410DRAFT_829130 [Rickenella mellea]|uniref:Uncharacterized protein n=1 Tax=Rickenella mellea TaxID=50990 RepID=A0A4Y7Q277_9AGAM|nr:hypothetical protein BD410DRAFT_829130 [Rickenella mellea]